MGQKDMTAKKLEDYEDVFADIVNVLLFQEELVLPEQLRDGPTESIYKAGKKRYRQQFRDTLKYFEKTGIAIAEVGIENQADTDNMMPVRVLSYDAASYMRQVRKKKALCPVVTLVLNFSDKRWNKAKALSELFPVPERLRPYFQDYRIHVVDMAYLPDETILRFKSTFRHVAHFFAHRREGRDYKPLDGEIRHLEEFLELLEVFTGVNAYQKVAPELIARQQKGEKVKMCMVMDAILSDGIEIGMKRGMELGGRKKLTELIERKLNKGKSLEVIAEELEEDISVVKDVAEEIREKNVIKKLQTAKA